ncbi:hypothetical protein Ddye_008036 [Dipteronia dyeriana]|uniref:Endonuclease/exonuclease/phosphatase domain-containing protein n=1 Tax=Dipteronia dyeriana TaxID=168575 RepID=A0AAE0CKZ6_9ROSI|nr:hypothetical protein Ddye_008036 [Dipteronia dyeriana]
MCQGRKWKRCQQRRDSLCQLVLLYEGFFILMLAMMWNIRGLGKVEKRRKVKSVILNHKLAIVFLQETKLAMFDSGIIRSLDGFALTRGVAVDAEGSTGGLITLWNEEAVTIKDFISNKCCIILVGTLNKLEKDVVCCNIYALNSERERRELWGFLINTQKTIALPWIMGGDFNTILQASERSEWVFNKWSARFSLVLFFRQRWLTFR